MDPPLMLVDRGTHRLPRGFPRPRGDGPLTVMIEGSHHGEGFPAHAGMDPYLNPKVTAWSSGFPAHAGMDPNGGRSRASPEGSIPGFPAHAGMDPS